MTAGNKNFYGLGVGYTAFGVDAPLGSDASYAYLQSWNSKHLQINNQGNNVIFNSAGGNVGIGVVTPGSKLDVSGNINATGTINAVSGLNINGSPVTSSQWSTSGSNINYATAGKIGIGHTPPTTTRQV